MRRADDLSDRAACVHGARHLPTRFYVTPLGRKLVCIDWQDRAPVRGRDGKQQYRHHPVWPMYQRKPCRLCGNLSFLSDCRGCPCHKACAEAEWESRAVSVPRRDQGTSMHVQGDFPRQQRHP